MQKIINTDDYPEMRNLTLNWVLWHSIGFIDFDVNETDAIISGSGTLVSAGNNYAILTADHVIEKLKRKHEIGIIFLTLEKIQVHRYMLNLDHTKSVTIGKASHSSEGPDLGYLHLLSDHDISNLKAKKSFYNLDKQRDKMLTTPPSIQSPGWAISGMAHEWTKDEEPIHGYKRVKMFKGIYSDGEVTEERHLGEFDYLNFEVKSDESYIGPMSYEGTSGGGLWYISYIQKNDNLEIYEGLLTGVVFYQSDFIDGINTIYCHGRESIYKNVYDKLISE